MSKQVSAKELAEIVTKLLTDPNSSGELDGFETFQQFMTDIAEVVCDHCGGEIHNPADLLEDVWYVGIHGNNSLPDAFGGIWREYDKEGELFAETSAEALADSGVTDYCNQVCGGGNCGTGDLCQYGIDHKTHMPPTKRNVFLEITDSKSMSIEAPDAIGGADTVEVRRDLLAAELLSQYPADTVITRERYDANDVFGEAICWLSPFFEFPNWEGRTIGELLNAYPTGADREGSNILQYRTNSPNKDGIHAKNVTMAELRESAPLPGNRWLLPDHATLQLVTADCSSV